MPNEVVWGYAIIMLKYFGVPLILTMLLTSIIIYRKELVDDFMCRLAGKEPKKYDRL